jgi:hypothetical protein
MLLPKSAASVAGTSSTGCSAITIAPRPERPSGIGLILVNLILPIRDLDNPFGYDEGDSAEDVSLKPLDDLVENLKAVP